MVNFRLIAVFLGVFGAGVLTGGFFRSGPVPQPVDIRSQADQTRADQTRADQTQADRSQATRTEAPPSVASGAPVAPSGTTEAPLQPRSVRTITIENPLSANPETTGRGFVEPPQPAPPPAKEQAESTARQASCNVSVCSRHYRSFDSATCTYQPYDGGARRLCEK